eukprot:CAMPEP_0119478012 /NCGR_PEP_ID=MMETSP1344-20130328/7948_1 /TAXON_ID=236787 /ORGANISM="Florenciella parvula, Strain CCMP2471" /LENGTH=511 /DNA_ID=CAMNT_0007512153 /DNA_START=206 /DNA_END=1742 /DNA_ORIENTATION=-
MALATASSYGAVPDAHGVEVLTSRTEELADDNMNDERRSPWRALAFSAAATLAIGAAVVSTHMAHDEGLLGGTGSLAAAKSQHYSHSSHHHHNKDSPTAAPTNPSTVMHGSTTIDELAAMYTPADPKASELTKELYTSLAKISYSKSFLFGHQNDQTKGQDFRDSTAGHYESDLNTATDGEEWAALYGFNLWSALNGTSMEHYVKSAFMKGGVIEVEWEADNPVTGEKLSAADCTGNPMDHILEGGSANEAWTGYLDNVVEEIQTYVVDDVQIPVMIRLFHEATGTWYWWGSSCVNSTQYVKAFQYTVDYLRDAGLNNLLVIYAPAKPSEYKDEALYELYPGDDYVDIMAWDRYGTTKYSQELKEDAHAIVPFADEHYKVPALAETGYYQGTMQNTYDADWWMDSFLKPIVENEYLSRIAYTITWTDYAEDCYWIPLEGDYTYDGFVRMSKSENVLFLDDSDWVNLPYATQIQKARKKEGGAGGSMRAIAVSMARGGAAHRPVKQSAHLAE